MKTFTDPGGSSLPELKSFRVSRFQQKPFHRDLGEASQRLERINFLDLDGSLVTWTHDFLAGLLS